jgi:hypothetical protein
VETNLLIVGSSGGKKKKEERKHKMQRNFIPYVRLTKRTLLSPFLLLLLQLANPVCSEPLPDCGPPGTVPLSGRQVFIFFRSAPTAPSVR